MIDVELFFASYVRAALATTSDESDESGGEPLDKNYHGSDIAPESRELMHRDCELFIEAHHAAIEGREEEAGCDFWLNRNGHGAGFWDGDWPEPAATTLSDASKAFGEVNLYVGDDGRIYQ